MLAFVAFGRLRDRPLLQFRAFSCLPGSLRGTAVHGSGLGVWGLVCCVFVSSNAELEFVQDLGLRYKTLTCTSRK